MKITNKWSLTTFLVAGILALAGCGGGGGGSGKTANQCTGNSDSFICEVYKVVNNLTSETADPKETDTLTATKSEDADPTTNI